MKQQGRKDCIDFFSFLRILNTRATDLLVRPLGSTAGVAQLLESVWTSSLPETVSASL